MFVLVPVEMVAVIGLMFSRLGKDNGASVNTHFSVSTKYCYR